MTFRINRSDGNERKYWNVWFIVTPYNLIRGNSAKKFHDNMSRIGHHKPDRKERADEDGAIGVGEWRKRG